MECWCEVVELEDGLDGFFYHKQCGLQDNGIRSVMVEIDETPLTNEKVRKTYVMGVQIMIELQIKALIEKFNVCPIVVDLIEQVWLRFVDSTNLFSDDWADKAFSESESQFQGEVKDACNREGETVNSLGERCSIIWYRSLSNKIPLSYSLAISFLACHLAREPILSTDIIKWAHEGTLPYFAAFVEIDKQMQLPCKACPLTSSSMFRPRNVIRVQKLESLAACIAQLIGLELPPVNFPAIASRYLKRLSLPVNVILSHACKIYEWAMPPELWLSANESMLPTHAFVLSILIVSIRILYNIHGFGKWEASLSSAVTVKNAKELSQSSSSRSDVDESVVEPCKKDLDATEILVLLHSKYNELIDASVDHTKDLEAYLEYCEKVVFAYQEEDKIIENLSELNQMEVKTIKDLWQFYKEKKKESCSLSPSTPYKRPQDHSQSNMNKTKKPKVKITLEPKESHRDREIRQMKSNMEENKFCYIPPRKRVQRHDYLHYTRKKGSGAYVYAAHADYYILLRSCARVAQLNVRSMHAAVLSFERRLSWLEKNIQHSFKVMPFYEDCC
ncbi:hypothetical protein SSX86_012168 [Deinandra increscens subsp. villosa]|uniref:TATA box-binding protein-associated factor RNA polymerase I subunit B n=1 Tax=Deinandra increscens subsp. villosa TaxID=3103831 RepID=A0AAP0D8U9_9ASTR